MQISPPPDQDAAPPPAEVEREHKLDLIRRRWSRRRIGAAGILAAMALIVVAGVALRLAVLSDPGRAAVMRAVEGQEIGRVGRLHVEGLSGDVFGDFSLSRLAIVDSKGAWVQASNVSLNWNPFALILRRFHARALHAETLQVLRRPELSPAKPNTPGGGLPVAVVIDDLRLRLQTLPAFSVRQGLWDVAGQANIRRNGVADGRLNAQSRLHQGDGLAVLFHLGQKGRMQVAIDGVEARGGAFAGSIGLPAADRFLVHARIQGTSDSTGTLAVTAQSGARTPLTGSGHWDKSGAAIDARLALDASSLSAAYATRAGPELHLTLDAHGLGGDRFQLDGAAIARDAQLTLRGPIDWNRRTTTGLDVTLAVTQLQRWVGDVHAGPTRAEGILSGSLDSWRYAGRVNLAQIDQWGLRLATAAGPAAFIHSPAENRLQLDLAATGGQGGGLYPVLFGAAPHIRLDGSRLKDGRFLVRDLGIDGAGMTLKGTGDRSLLGLFSFKGDLALQHLERAHPGAKGVMHAAWTAHEIGGKPWSITADAQGEAFATGYPEVDHLLGPAPKLTAEATYGPSLIITRSQITGESGQAAVKGTLDNDGVAALDVDWSAKGPFEVGPVEIAGEAMGTGKLTGRIVAPTLDLAADLTSVDFGALVVKPAHLALQLANDGGLNGQIALTGASDWGPASGKAHFRFVTGGLDLADIAADAGGVKAAGALSLRDGAPSTADLTLAAGPGAFLERGALNGTLKLEDRAGGAVAQLSLDGRDLAAPGMAMGVSSLHLSANGPFAHLPFQLAAVADQPFAWRFNGDGVLTQSGTGANLTRQVSLTGAGKLRQADVKTLQPVELRFGPGEQTARLRLGVGSGRAELDAREAAGAVDIKGQVADVDIAGFANAYVGKISGQLALTGQGSRLGGTAEAAIAGGRDRDAPANVAMNADLRATLADSRIKVDATASNPQGLTAKLALDVPAAAAADPFRIALVGDKPLTGSLAADGELRPLWDLFAGSSQTLSGRGSVQASLAGTLNRLLPTGQAAIEGGRFEDAGTGFDLRNLAAQANFDQSGVDVRRFAGDDGLGGKLSGSGTVGLGPNAGSTFTLDLQNFRLIDNDLARASTSGKVTVTRDSTGKARLAGALTVDRADITANPPVPTGVVPLDVVEMNRPGAPREAMGSTGRGGPQIAVDVAINAARGVFIKGNGLDAELSLQAHVGGTTATPELSGVARVVRGDYQFAGQRFEFDETGTIRLASLPENIRIDLTATRDDPTLKAIVRIQGTAARPEITFSSVPALPQDEVLSQVLFGRSASQLTPLEAAQLASAVTGLATGGGFDVLGGLRQFARLDRLAVAGGGAGTAATVSGGKYLTSDVYLELTGGGRTGPTAQVEWRVRRNLSLVSTVGTQGDARLSVRFRHNY